MLFPSSVDVRTGRSNSLVNTCERRRIEVDEFPADRVQFMERLAQRAVFIRNDIASARPRFVDVPALNVSGVQYQGRSGEDWPFMHTPQAPCIVAFGFEDIQRCRRVGLVSIVSAQRRMKNTDIHPSPTRRRIPHSEILGNGAGSEALTVQRNAEMRQLMALRGDRAE